MPTKTMARGRIEVKTYEPMPYDKRDDGPDLVELQVTESFVGDVDGDGAVRFLQAGRKDGSASFCGIERVEGTLAGRSGTFLLQDDGGVEGNTVRGEWWVIPGSATGELTGLRGEGGFEAELGQNADWTLEYWFED